MKVGRTGAKATAIPSVWTLLITNHPGKVSSRDDPRNQFSSVRMTSQYGWSSLVACSACVFRDEGKLRKRPEPSLP